MKKEIAFLASMIILGIMFGIGIVAILAAIAVPNFTNMIITLSEKADYELMNQKFNWAAKNTNIILFILFLFLIVTGILFLINLNPNFKNKFKEKTARLKAAAVLLGCLACFFLLLYPVIGSTSYLFSFFSFPQAPNNIAIFLVFFFGTGLLWLIAGEMGWAGDFSSWKMGVQGKDAKPLASFVLGGIVGSAAFGFYYLNNWAFTKYFILVSEVLDKSGETSYLGFKLIDNELMFMSGMSLGILAGVIIALSPTYKTTRQRLVRLIFPAMLLAVLIPVILSTYQNAVAKYDLGKKSLAEAVGVPDKASVVKTIVLFAPDKTSIQEWPLKAKGDSFIASDTIEVSYETLKKVEDYIAGHKEGSVYNYSAQDALVNGYYALWDIKKGMEAQLKASENKILHRLILISRFTIVPVIPEYLNYLRVFTDESKWHIGGRYALRIAQGFMHFGMIEEANAWVKKAKEKGEDISRATFLNEPVLKSGTVFGVIKVNGKPPANTKVALLQYWESFKKIEDITLSRRLVDVRKPDSYGKFAFDHLGRGEYFLAIMTDMETIPYNLPAEKFSAENPPGIIKIDVSAPNQDLGNINIVVK